MFVKVRSRQRKHNLNRNYNLMGFDTIEINLVQDLQSNTWLTSVLNILEGLVCFGFVL